MQIRSLSLALIAAGLLLAPSFATAQGVVDPADADERETNYLEINGATGAVVADIYRGSEVTDVRITGVATSVEGYGLIDPYGVKVWLNQVSTSTGDVEFWYTRLVPGVYTVVRTTLGVDLPIITFQPPPTMVNAPINLCGVFTSVDTQYQLVGRDEQWVDTPLLFVHSPYGNSQARGQANVGGESWKALYLFPGEMSSSKTYTSQLDTHNGQSMIYRQTAKWGLYARGYATCGGWVSQGTSAKVYEWGTTRGGMTINDGASRTTDSDDQNQFCNSTGSTCLTVNLRYISGDWNIPGCSGTGSFTEGVSSRQAFRVGGSVSVGGSVVSMELFKAEVGAFRSFSYTYTFPCGVGGSWWADELPSGGNHVSGWAFRKV